MGLQPSSGENKYVSNKGSVGWLEMENMSGENRNSLEIEEANRVLIESIRRKLEAMPSHQSFIHEVPGKLRSGKLDEDEIVPQIVSIGPIHCGKENLEPLDDHKKWYLHALLARSTTPLTCLEESVKAMRAMEEEIRKCYRRPINLSSNKLVEMMIFDGYFMLELFNYFEDEGVRNENDPIFNTPWMLPMLREDLMSLENQVPFIILNKLFELRKDRKQGGHALSYLVLNFFEPMLPTLKSIPTNSSFQCKHVLELLRNYLVFSSQQPVEIEKDDNDNLFPKTWEITFSVTDLLEAGVKFKKVEDCGLLDIRFNDKDGVLEIPHFAFGRSQARLLRNLLVLEQCDGSLTAEITSYVRFLRFLLKTQGDVRLLHQQGILKCHSAYDKMADRVNKLQKGVKTVHFRYQDVCLQINKYYRSDYNRWRTTLKRDYFNIPWTIISFIAAIVLLVLTFLQTVFTISS